MNVIRHAIDRDQFLTLISDDAGDVFVQFLVELGCDARLAVLNREDRLNVDLREGVGHEVSRRILLIDTAVRL